MNKLLLSLSIIVLYIIFYSYSIKAQWVECSNGLYEGETPSIAIKDNYIFAGTNAGVYLSKDNGDSWVEKNSGLPIKRTGLVIDENRIFAISSSIFLSTDNGESWTELNTGLLKNSTIRSITINENMIFASTSNGVFLSTDNGDTWTQTNSGITTLHIYTIAVSGNSIFAGTLHGVFLSTDKGKSWAPKNSGLEKGIFSLNVREDQIIAGTFEGVYFSTDNGESWTPKNSGLPNTDIQSFVIHDNIIFACGWEGVFLSTDNGDNWTVINSGLTNRTAFALVSSGDDIYVSARGVYKAKISDFGITSAEDNLLTKNLSVFPNPTSNTLNLNCDDLTNVDHSKIKIYSQFGHEIHSNIISNSESNVEYDVSTLPQGIYFVYVPFGTRVERMKFVKICN